MEPIVMEQDLGGRTIKIETGLLAKQAHGAVMVTLGDTIVLATATMGGTRPGMDFFPMMVDFEERYYAAGKIKGSRFVKREGRPSDNAILSARLIDRPLRPLFPKDIINDVQIVCTVLSADLEVDPDTIAMIGASAALMISGMPFQGPVSGVRVGYSADGQYILNPTHEQLEQGKLDLVVAGTKDAITMVEAAAKMVSEEVLLGALEFAHKNIKDLCLMQEQFKAKVNPKPMAYDACADDTALTEKIVGEISDAQLGAIEGETKHDVKEKMHLLEDELLAKYATNIEAGEFTKSQVKAALQTAIENKMRENILKHEKRIDGRKIDEIRNISCQTKLLPRTHGSALFQRGETQALTITTLGSPRDAQIIDTMDMDVTKRYIHHYNFPPYSVGEVKPMRGPSRRDIGHGDLAERALRPVIPEKDVFGYTVMVVSEIVSCNGSSSMASVCGSTLSLMDAGVPITAPVAGIAMGLISDDKGNYKILTDIQGLEDFAGDMDFKVAGTKDGITALQMDIKVLGLSLEVMREALSRAKVARNFVLDKMLAVLPEPRKELSQYAPVMTTIKIDPDMIRIVIGKGGETIQKIVAETGADIDIDDDGIVTITAPDQVSGKKAIGMIEAITYVPKVGDTFDGKVTRLMEFGAFVEFIPGKEGLVHISELDTKRVNKVDDVVKVGDKFKVKLIKVDDQGRYNLSRKALLS